MMAELKLENLYGCTVRNATWYLHFEPLTETPVL
jgi:hypothetical protein